MIPLCASFNILRRHTIISVRHGSRTDMFAVCRHNILRNRRYVTTTPQEVENTNAGHSRFLAEASAKTKWKESSSSHGLDSSSTRASTEEDLDSITEGKGKVSPTSSHLFKFILPLGLHPRPDASADSRDVKIPPPTVFLLHPSQPLSHVARLIIASLAPNTPNITFRCRSPRGKYLQWADSTDVADFIKDAARATEFEICITNEGKDKEGAETVIHVEVPSFADRTRYLRRRLEIIEKELGEMEELKRKCDDEAHQGARRMAVGGFGMLVVYWAAVARLTFWDYGWDIMEPITYLSGLSTVIVGYLWFLYQGREVSYSSVLQRSISARREQLYKTHGLDIDRWLDLVAEAKSIRKEISKIAEDYDEQKWKAEEEERQKREVKEGQQATDANEAHTESGSLDDRTKAESKQ